MAITKLHEIHTRRRSRNVGLGLALGVFVILMLGLTVAKVTVIDPAIMQREIAK
ncbi:MULTISPECIES: hypothetical protein [Roseobacteraceae]|jgi:hypothetical protein|uniref:Cytochrome C oxidase assembly protein n=2 Tax=Celeribacter baekdonensis TaxID=875171 RepID=K2ITF8_9RHOB|nr:MULTISPECIES: hypothetical protein [Roseobacteraceae]MBU0645694.1 cytochrome C oxidase assembly protein [Alphaproteobacteria bacterium]EKE73551.1 hypothetical protein B30_05792 [Celeribacter baekdonensis B30]KAB6717610.1 cytochrome C oxidase assembly protein [Roseobacter sp. TSBP12]MBU1278283.1 cytochrome C oxidase assembly protein [Alphaproteobacteria bacterium]MBU1573170.1 cytochrome C oxidase assembly protein [Alphaproteobacteria bacterium]|tara:strand:- start:8996 stop:9157 length:162 start_codon:yes stop_codon:yes gene_type:complete